MDKKLDYGQKHIMRLISRDKGADGWATVSEQLYPVLSRKMPEKLMVFEKLGNGGRVKLTIEGEAVLNAMAWL